MCGLTGVAVHPDAHDDVRTLAAVAFNDLLVRTQSRGRHATGIAAYVNADKRVITVKRAEDATRFTRRKEYEAVLNGLADGHISHLIGHTRYATQGAAELDDNAHPFTFGAVTGAHNGIITNWRDVERDLRKRGRKEVKRGFHVDSEAAFALLNVHEKKPHKALEQLEGYFALTWLKGASVYLARTDAPLTLVYVKAMRALFWNSERANLAAALGEQGIDITSEEECVTYDPTPGKVYRYTPVMFTNDETNVVHGETFEFAKAPPRMNWARPNATTTTRRGWFPGESERVTTTALAANGARVKTTTTRPVVTIGTTRDILANTLGADKVYSFPELTRKLNEAGRRVIQLERAMKKALTRIDELERDAATPYRDDAPQLTFPALDDVDTFASEGGTCTVCAFIGTTRDPLIATGDGEYVHRACVELELASGDVSRG